MDERVHAYLALAVQARIRELVEQMVVASKHRTGLLLQTLVDREQELLDEAVAKNPGLLASSKIFVKIDNDPKLKMSELEKAERDFERSLRQERGYGGISSEMAESGADISAEIAADTPAGKKKSKKKQVQSEAVKSRLMNDASLRAIGGKSYGWMQQTKDPTMIVPPSQRRKEAAAASSAQSSLEHAQLLKEEMAKSAAKELDEIQLRSTDGEKIMRPMTRRDLHRVSLADALFSLEKESTDHRALIAKWTVALK